MFSQLLVELHIQTLETQTRVIKAAGEEDLRTMLLNRYPLKLNEMPNTMTSLIKAVEELLPDIKRIVDHHHHLTVQRSHTPHETAKVIH